MPHSEAVGIDIWLTNFIATSNGLLVKRQKFFIDAERKLKLLQKSASRKKIGSNNWRKAQKKIALLHKYVTNCRKDWHHKLSHKICKDVGIIFVENLNLIMVSSGMLGKYSLDASWRQFFTRLEQTCLKYGVYFLTVNTNKTSLTCLNCLIETGKKQLFERTHLCSNCGYTINRGLAAAQVVLIKGLATVGHTVKMLSCK
jgi:putative transposase